MARPKYNLISEKLVAGYVRLAKLREEIKELESKNSVKVVSDVTAPDGVRGIEISVSETDYRVDFPNSKPKYAEGKLHYDAQTIPFGEKCVIKVTTPPVDVG